MGFKHQRLTVLWALLILLLCVMPGKSLPNWEWADIFQIDKFIHALLFVVLAFLMATGMRRQQSAGTLRVGSWWTTAVVCILYGIGLEIMQGTMLTGRTGDPLDGIANSVGAVVGLVYLRWEERRTLVAQ